MRILVLGGSGKIGSAVAWDLARDPAVEEIGLADVRRDALDRVRDWVGSDRTTLHELDVEDRERTVELMRGYDTVAVALPDRRASYLAWEAALEAGTHLVDMLEEYHRRPDLYETEGLVLPEGMSDLHEYGESLHRRAEERGLTFLDGMGFAPGLSNVTLGEGIRELDTAEVAIARVGGIPRKEIAQDRPLRYMITWAFEHVLREYMVKLNVIRGGEVVEVDAGGDRETFRFQRFGRDETLECAVTPGMPSFIYTRPELTDFAEKTVRWPGHWDGIDTLKECGLLDLDPVTVDGVEVVPRKLLSNLVTPRLRPEPGETDVCVMYNTLTGTRGGNRVTIEYFLWNEADREHGISAMMRSTAFPVAIGARMVADGRIDQRGIVAPEDAVRGDLYRQFLDELEKRDILIAQVTTEIDEPGHRRTVTLRDQVTEA